MDHEAGEEPSLSAPSSPTLKSPFHRKLSHSCDDLLSASDLSPHPHLARPFIKVTAAGQREGMASPRLAESNEESDDSECELKMINIDSVGRPANLPATPLVDILEVGKPAENEGEAGSRKGDDESSEMSKFSRLKGRIMKTVKSSGFLSKPISPQISGEESSGDAAGVSKRTPSPPLLGEEGTRMAAIKQRFKMSSPGLFRKMRRGASVTPSQSAEEGELRKEEARKNCKSCIIFL